MCKRPFWRHFSKWPPPKTCFCYKWHKSGINTLSNFLCICLDELKRLTVTNIILSKQIYLLDYPN